MPNVILNQELQKEYSDIVHQALNVKSRAQSLYSADKDYQRWLQNAEFPGNAVFNFIQGLPDDKYGEIKKRLTAYENLWSEFSGCFENQQYDSEQAKIYAQELLGEPALEDRVSEQYNGIHNAGGFLKAINDLVSTSDFELSERPEVKTLYSMALGVTTAVSGLERATLENTEARISERNQELDSIAKEVNTYANNAVQLVKDCEEKGIELKDSESIENAVQAHEHTMQIAQERMRKERDTIYDLEHKYDDWMQEIYDLRDLLQGQQERLAANKLMVEEKERLCKDCQKNLEKIQEEFKPEKEEEAALLAKNKQFREQIERTNASFRKSNPKLAPRCDEYGKVHTVCQEVANLNIWKDAPSNLLGMLDRNDAEYSFLLKNYDKNPADCKGLTTQTKAVKGYMDLFAKFREAYCLTNKDARSQRKLEREANNHIREVLDQFKTMTKNALNSPQEKPHLFNLLKEKFKLLDKDCMKNLENYSLESYMSVITGDKIQSAIQENEKRLSYLSYKLVDNRAKEQAAHTQLEYAKDDYERFIENDIKGVEKGAHTLEESIAKREKEIADGKAADAAELKKHQEIIQACEKVVSDETEKKESLLPLWQKQQELASDRLILQGKIKEANKHPDPQPPADQRNERLLSQAIVFAEHLDDAKGNHNNSREYTSLDQNVRELRDMAQDFQNGNIERAALVSKLTEVSECARSYLQAKSDQTFVLGTKLRHTRLNYARSVMDWSQQMASDMGVTLNAKVQQITARTLRNTPLDDMVPEATTKGLTFINSKVHPQSEPISAVKDQLQQPAPDNPVFQK